MPKNPNILPILEKQLYNDRRYVYGIPVDLFCNYYNVPGEVRQTFQKYPVLCYLLGRVTDKPQKVYDKNSRSEKQAYVISEGSGMMIVNNPGEAIRSKMVLNHELVSGRRVYCLTKKILSLSSSKLSGFQKLGYNLKPLRGLKPELLLHFVLVSHCKRIEAGEKMKYGIDDEAHPSTIPGEAGLLHLIKYQAPVFLQKLMRVESPDYLPNAGTKINKRLILPNIVDNILVYCDWTNGQKPTTIESRFKELRAEYRESSEALNKLEAFGQNFQSALKIIFSSDIINQLKTLNPYNWESEIAQAYCQMVDKPMSAIFPHLYM